MERLKAMKETLASCVQTQLANIQNADTHELGEAVDMIKDLEQAMYYCAKTKEIEDCEEEHKEIKKKLEELKEKHHYGELMPYPTPYYPIDRDMDRDMDRMYYSSRQPRNSRGEFISRRNYEDFWGNSSDGDKRYNEHEVPLDLRDTREGRSPISRRHYMESKEMHHDKDKKMKELEQYMKELSEDIVEMIEDASPEEKQMLERKMTNLTSRIAQLNA